MAWIITILLLAGYFLYLQQKATNKRESNLEFMKSDIIDSIQYLKNLAGRKIKEYEEKDPFGNREIYEEMLEEVNNFSKKYYYLLEKFNNDKGSQVDIIITFFSYFSKVKSEESAAEAGLFPFDHLTQEERIQERMKMEAIRSKIREY